VKDPNSVGNLMKRMEWKRKTTQPALDNKLDGNSGRFKVKWRAVP